MALSSFRKPTPDPSDDPAAAVSSASLALDVFDVDLLSEAVAGSGLEHRQLGRGPFRGQLKRLRLGELLLDSGCYNQTLQSRGCFAAGAVVLGCILAEREAGCINAHRFGRNDLVVFPEGAEMDYLVPADTEWVALQLPRRLLLDAGIPPEVLNGVGVYSATRPANAALADLLRRLLSSNCGSGGAPAGPRRDSDATVGTLLETLRRVLDPETRPHHARRTSYRKRSALVQGFERLVLDAGAATPSVPELAAGLGVSQRTLELAFREHLSMSLKRYAALMRLNEVQKALLKAPEDAATVSELARRHGIRQLGRFAGEYRRQFGELPSKTLQRPADRPGPTAARRFADGVLS